MSDPPGSDPIDAGLRSAAELFDEGRYHEAHEVLDELWESSSGADSDFLKGLIQAAICLHHWQAGNPGGARKLYRGHRQYLGACLPSHRGLDVARFLAAMQEALAPLLRAPPGEEPAFEPSRRPRLEFGAGGATERG